MKKFIIIFVILPVLFLISCNDLLDYTETTGYDKELVFTNWSRSTQFVNNLYTYLRSDFNSVGGAMRSSGCDESEYVWELSNVHDYNNGTWSSINTVDDVWAHYYSGIRACNLFLENAAGKTFDDYKYVESYNTEMRKFNNLQWEVRFLRAYFHFELAKRYGNIPIVKKVLTPEESNSLTQSTFVDVADFIAFECDTVFKNIENDYKTDAVGTNPSSVSKETGRITRAAAIALKTKALLYAASPLFCPIKDTEKWIRAARAAKMGIDSAVVLKIGLESSYTTIFNSWTTKELILGVRESDSNTFESLNFPIGSEGGNTGNTPTQDLVDAFEMKFLAVSNTGNGRPIFDPLSNYNPIEPYKNRDPRLGFIVALNNTNWVYNKPLEIWEGGKNGLPIKGATKTGYYLKKFVDSSRDLRPDQNTKVKHVWPIFRYADILLSYAEAMNEAFGPDYTDGEFTKTAVSQVNLIRDRTAVKMKAIPAGLTQDSLQKRIQNERRVEFAFEDQRFWDVRRWKLYGDDSKVIAVKRMSIKADFSNPSTPKFTYTPYTIENGSRIWDKKMYLYPIPYSELLKNKNLIQNEGW